MRPNTMPHGRTRRLALGMTATAALAVTLAACSSSGGAPAHTSRHLASTPAATASTAATPSVATASDSGLSGIWHGSYGGAYSGTFVLRWQQSGSNLSGRIHISNPSATLPVHGKLVGGSIKFGTVGSYRISYTGTVSGSSMSGAWQLNGPGSGGNWSASSG